MSAPFRAVVAVLLVAACPALAQGVSGTWSGPTGRITLKQSGKSVTGSAVMDGDNGTVSATVSGAKLSGSISYGGDKEAFVGTVSGDTLKLIFEGDEEGAETFTRGGKAAPAPAEEVDPEPMQAPKPAAPSAPMKAEPAPQVGAATGGVYKDEGGGWSIRAPANWRFGEKAGRVLFGSDTEAGLIVAWYAPGTTYEQLQQIAAQGINEDGMSLAPTGPAQPLQAPAGKALGVDLKGMGQNGQQLAARAVGVAGPNGAVAVLGITSPEQFKALRPKVDAMLKSAALFTPKAGAGAHLLRGTLCNYSGGSVASWSKRVSFDGRGHATAGSEMNFGGQFNDQYGNNTGGFVGYSGNANQESSGGSYTVSGNTVTVRLGGQAIVCSVHHRQQNGAISELMCDGKLYGAGLCD
ncbi:MAG: hypothetical protein IT380_20030 [Myxococcales bacterium]|nr:hypothetical protein [Myxococcales bacterium]